MGKISSIADGSVAVTDSPAFKLIFPVGADEDNNDNNDRHLPGWNKKAKFRLESDENGNLILPDPDLNGGLKLVQMDKIIRAFLSHHYRELILQVIGNKWMICQPIFRRSIQQSQGSRTMGADPR